MNARIVGILHGRVILAVWLACMLAATFGPALPGPQDPPSKPFLHKQHVPKAWVASPTEYWRDCRGCHRFDEKHPVSTPQEECASCHVPTKVANAPVPTLVPAFDAGWQKDLSGHRTRTRDAFRHHTHAMLECRECHLPEADDFTVAAPWLNSGPGQCVRCHDPSRVDATVAGSLKWFQGALDKRVAADLDVPYYEPLADKAALAKRLVDVFAAADAGINRPPLPPGGDFDHGDHVGLLCSACHTDIVTASATQVGTGSIPAEGCKQCHFLDAQRTPVRTAPKAGQSPRDLQSLGAFAHADHFRWQQPGGAKKPGVCSEAAYQLLERKDGQAADSCAACHAYTQTVPGRGERNFPFGTAQSRETYLGCMVCHEVPGWQTGETKAAPRHASTGAKVADAAASHWAGCVRCHEFGQPDLGKLRPTDQVARMTERTFTFPANTHPDITRIGSERAAAAGRPAAQDCTECHRAKVPALSSRLLQKQFTHASHLAANATAAACLECHPSAGTATDTAALGAAGQRTYTLQGCNKCHWGGDVTEAEGSAPSPRAVVRFPHGPHVGAGKQACSECHEAGGDGRDIVTKPAALACTQCHDHRTGGPKTEAIFDDAVTSCARCHHDAPIAAGQRAIASVPPIRGSEAARTDRRYRTDQSTFAGFTDSQFHPVGVACAECHKANDLKPLPLPVTVHLAAVRPAKTSVHAEAGFTSPPDCLRCHWKTAGQGWPDAVRASTGTEQEKAFRRDPNDAKTRSVFGNLKEGYPGSPRAKG